MRWVRFLREDNRIAYGFLDEDDDVTEVAGSPFVQWEATGDVHRGESVRLLAPVLPTKIVAVGRNYADHAAEFDNPVPDEPVIFLKPSTTVIGPNDAIRLPRGVGRIDHEGELAVVIGRVAKSVRVEDASTAVFGYTAANDVTARDLQKKDGQWGRAKGFDTFCPLGPVISDDVDPLDVHLAVRVNGTVRQSASTSDMVHGVGSIVSFISQVMTLLPGDVILTGTPAGVGPIVDGDTVEVDIEGIGVLANIAVTRGEG